MTYPRSARWICVLLACAISAAAAAHCAGAAPPLSEKQKRDKLATLAKEAADAFIRGDWPKAEESLRAELEISPEDPIASYNLACAIAAQGKDASSDLVQAINNGYDDIRRMRRDPVIASAVKSDPVQKLFADWDQVLLRNIDRNIARSAKLVPKTKAAKEPDLKIAYLSSFDAQSTDLSRDELRAIERWAQATVFTKLQDEKELALDPWALVVLPNRTNFNQWAAETYGGASRGGIAVIGGAYDHDTKRLVAQDLGGTLRHEFMHVLHWRDMTRCGQVHPIWLQEGLCSLAEDYDLTGKDLATGTITPAHSWRTNAVIRLARNNRVQPIEKLITMPSDGFSGSRPLASYAEARTLMMYLLDQHKLGEFYEHYCTLYRDDFSGRKALEATFGKELPQIERDYRAWVRALHEVAENVASGGASMGVEVSMGQGEGPVVTQSYNHPRFHTGDVLVTMNHRPVRDTPELVRLLQLCHPGDAADFTVRRGKLLVDVPVELVAK